MKNIFLFITLSFFLSGCNINPNKEARIQKLETELQQTMDKIHKLEGRVEKTEALNEQLKTRILELEKR